MKYQFNTNSFNVIRQATIAEHAEYDIKILLPFAEQTCDKIDAAVFELIDNAVNQEVEEDVFLYLGKIIAALKEPYIIDIFEYNKEIERLNSLKEMLLAEMRDVTFNTRADY